MQQVKTAPGVAHVANGQNRACPPQAAAGIIGQLTGGHGRALAGVHEFNGPEGPARYRRGASRGHERDPLHGNLGDEPRIAQHALQAQIVELMRPQAGGGVIKKQSFGVVDARVEMKSAAHAHEDAIPDGPVQDALEGGRG